MAVTRRGLKMPQIPPHLAVKAGILAGATYPEQDYRDALTGEDVPDKRAGMPVAVIARALNYGDGQNHPRPFMDQAIAKHKREWSQMIVKLLRSGESYYTALSTVGQVMMEDIQQEITTWPADNSEEWADHKGFNAGLRYTRIMLRSVKFETQGVSAS